MNFPGIESKRTTMDDEIKINEDLAEWMDQKKSEMLAWLIENQPQDEIEVEKFSSYADYIFPTIQKPQEHYRYPYEGQTLQIFVQEYRSPEVFKMVVIAVEIPQDDESIVFPILSIPCRNMSWLKKWLKPEYEKKQLLH
jgi:hypothetical protein